MTVGDRAPLRIAFAADLPEHEESRAIAAWLASAPGLDAVPVALAEAAAVEGRIVWIHGVRPAALEDLGQHGPELLLRGRVLLTGGAAALPAAAGVDQAAPNDLECVPWPATADDDGLPPLRGHASLRGHPLFDGLGTAPVTSAPHPGEARLLVSYMLPVWPARGRVLAVERSRSAVHAGRATIWEYDARDGRTLCVGGHLPFGAEDPGLRGAVERLARNALGRAAAPGRPDETGEPWPRPDASTVEDRTLAFPELPLLEEPFGSLEFRLRRSGSAADDAPFAVAGRRALAAGGAERGLDVVWAHPVRAAAHVRITGAVGAAITTTPLGVERRLSVGEAVVLERVIVPREGPACVVEWQARSGPVEVEIGWTCDLALAAPYPAGTMGGLRWRKAGRGLMVAGSGEDDAYRAVFAFSLAPGSLEVEDASDQGRPLVRVRARVRLSPRVPVRLAIVAGAGDAVIRRALAAADRPHAIVRARQGNAERLMTERLSLAAPDPAAVQDVEWAKHGLDGRMVEAPGLGRSLVAGYDDVAPDAPRFEGAAGVRAALGCLAAGDFGAARDTLTFLGRHQDPAGRVVRACTTSGFSRHDDPEATPLYLLLAARYLAWTGDLAFLRGEWRRVLRGYDGCRDLGSREPGSTAAGILAAALPELADAAESIGDRGAAVELRGVAVHGGDRGTAVESAASNSGIQALVGGILGVEPDAARGRLVLRPTPPEAWGRFGVSALVVGDTSVDLDYRRSGATHTFRLTQTRGAAPLQVVLEPSLPGARLRTAAVDGGAAELDPRSDGDRIAVPVQVVLDHTRTVVLETDWMPRRERLEAH